MVVASFDLAGGLDGLPIKLIEFNADTPTSLFETSIVQWALLKHNGMDETHQFKRLGTNRLGTDHFQEVLISRSGSGLYQTMMEIRVTAYLLMI